MENARKRGNGGLTSSDAKAIERHFAAGGVFTRGMAVVMKDKNAIAGVLAAVTEAARSCPVPNRAHLATIGKKIRKLAFSATRVLRR